jgi:hypothetical protein
MSARSLFAAVSSLTLLAAASAVPSAPPLAAQDTTTVLVRIGVDTLAVEQWVQSADRLEAVSVYRTPRTTVRRYSVELDGAGAPSRAIVQTGSQPAQERAVPAGAIPVAGAFYAPFALAVALAARSGEEEVELQYQMGDRLAPATVRRTGEGVFTLPNQFGGMLEARVRPDGGLVAVDAGGGTTVERVERLDLEEVARAFAARDEAGTGLGPLSPRDSAEARIDGATVAVAYGRPSARGRAVMGDLVPFGAVWRAGANVSTHLTIDRAIIVGGLPLEPGTYSLLAIPERDRWTLIVNRATGQSGLVHDAKLDVGRVPMAVRALPDHVEQFTIRVDPADGGGVLRLQWERTEASVPLRVAETPGG